MKGNHFGRVIPSLVLALVAGTLLWLVALAPEAAAQGPIWPTISLQAVETGFTSPIHITHAGDGSGRIFVVEQDGTIRLIQNGAVIGTPFLDISERVRSPIDQNIGGNSNNDGGNEEGLLSVAFPPDYASKGHFYVYYTNLDSNNVVARFALSSTNVANPASEQIILTIPHPGQQNHNGGQLNFGPNDGYLYVSTGDGGGGGDPDENGQDLSTLLGKILRLDVETGNPPTYTIPATNPFTQTPGLDEIWAYGLRNPWRTAFDRQTGDLYIGDVGQGTREEVDYQAAASSGGENYGWDVLEGNLCFEPSSGCTLPPDYVPPIHDYNQDPGGHCSVTGGYVYRGQFYSLMQGVYFYADYCSGIIWGLQQDVSDVWQNNQLLDTNHQITTFGEDQAGNLYLAARSGTIYEIVGSVLAAPSLAASKQVSAPTGSPGQTFTYTITLTSSGPPLTQTTYLTDTLPGGLAYISGTMTATFGLIDDSGPELLWNGQFNPTTTLQITYQVTATGAVTGSLQNLVEVNPPGLAPFTTTATVIIDPKTLYLPFILKP
ncbi:MAG: PQQ-dependent sugar dehydrogenase [Anaerolineae bacterium]|nr:PQQ-dependent sugar dehydrogenase [Anaerolineae bacterium]